MSRKRGEPARDLERGLHGGGAVADGAEGGEDEEGARDLDDEGVRDPQLPHAHAHAHAHANANAHTRTRRASPR